MVLEFPASVNIASSTASSKDSGVTRLDTDVSTALLREIGRRRGMIRVLGSIDIGSSGH